MLPLPDDPNTFAWTVLKEVADGAGAGADGKGSFVVIFVSCFVSCIAHYLHQIHALRLQAQGSSTSRTSVPARLLQSAQLSPTPMAMSPSSTPIFISSHLQAQPEQLLIGTKPSLPSPHRPQPFFFPQLMVTQASTQLRQ
ncbi:hypothetical protein CPC08DRAFT_771208 [Agrocybe pediades]|nr:hypothetical protein CPC08DRAFT_771208 [Agrocybe pediades]